MSESAMAMLVDYTWPGNVRELENMIERAVTLTRSDTIVPDDLPITIQGARGDRRVLDDAVERTLPLDEVEKQYIRTIPEKTGGNKYQAAHALCIDPKTLYRSLLKSKASPMPESDPLRLIGEPGVSRAQLSPMRD